MYSQEQLEGKKITPVVAKALFNRSKWGKWSVRQVNIGLTQDRKKERVYSGGKVSKPNIMMGFTMTFNMHKKLKRLSNALGIDRATLQRAAIRAAVEKLEKLAPSKKLKKVSYKKVCKGCGHRKTVTRYTTVGA